MISLDRARHLVIAVLLAGGLGACVRTNAAVLDVTAQRAPICPNGVKIFTDTAQIGGPYQAVALLNSTGESNWTSEQQMLESQRQKAAEVGANGILFTGIQEASAGAKVAAAFLGTGTQRKGHATAIFVPGDSARVAAACDGIANRMEVR